MKKVVSILVLSLILASCAFRSGMKSPVEDEVHIATVNNNVCKRLKDKVILYAIFVDSRYTNPWTEHDIYSSIDSMNLAIEWIEKQAEDRGVPLDIELDFHQDAKDIIPIEANLMRQTLSKTLFNSNGVRNVDRWADKVAKTALVIYGRDTSKVTRTKIVPKDRERLLARVRDVHKTDNVALIYFINNYYTDEVSVAIHTAQDYDPEYAVVSFKEPATIAHEFLHLFGALDLYKSPFDKAKQVRKFKSFAMREFPNEIMAFPHRGLDSLDISPLTEYLIGWDRDLEEKYSDMITGGKVRVAKY
jgi:hypothetical protein